MFFKIRAHLGRVRREIGPTSVDPKIAFPRFVACLIASSSDTALASLVLKISGRIGDGDKPAASAVVAVAVAMINRRRFT